MTDQKLDEAKGPVKEADASSIEKPAAVEKEKDNEADQTLSSLVDKVEHAVGRVKEKITGGGK
jgi:archaellum component FlaC